MNKITITALFSASFMFAFVGTAWAVHGEIPAETSTVVAKKDVQIGIDGSIRMRGYTDKDTVLNSADKSAYDGRVRLGVTGKLGDDVKGYVQLETWDGSNSAKDTYTWGGTNLNSGGATKGSLQVLQAWIDYNPNMVGVKVGHMPISLGNKLFYDHTGSGDDAIYAYLNPNKNYELGFLAVKLDDSDYPVANPPSSDSDMYSVLLDAKIGDSMKFGFNATDVKIRDAEREIYNIGIYLSGKVNKFSYLADGEFQLGDHATNEDKEAYAALVSTKYNFGKGYLGLLLGYGSGDDSNTATKNENYTNYLTDTIYQVIIPGYRLKVPGQANKYTGLANMFLVQISGGTKGPCPFTKKDVDIKVTFNWMQLNEGHDLLGTKEDDIGVEVDLFATWKLTKGLVYKVEAGFLLAGDVWSTSIIGDQDDAYFVRHGLELKF